MANPNRISAWARILVHLLRTANFLRILFRARGPRDSGESGEALRLRAASENRWSAVMALSSRNRPPWMRSRGESQSKTQVLSTYLGYWDKFGPDWSRCWRPFLPP